jgi:hypothetical protein
MAVVSDIEGQFEQLQRAANGNARQPGDPVIGQGLATGEEMKFPLKWGEAAVRSSPGALARAVTMKGGEYFFLPSMTFLRRLDNGQ